MSQLFTLLLGSGAILFIAWYFFGKKEASQETTGSTVTIKVDAGYSPSNIILKKNQLITLKITRTDQSNCLEQIVIPNWNISKHLPLNQEVSIEIKPQEIGEFPFHCGMNMFHGKIIVRE